MKPENLEPVIDHYTRCFQKHGPTPQGVNWNAKEAQEVRFEQFWAQLNRLKKLNSYELIDYGCGYGAFFDYLKSHGTLPKKYYGYDLSEPMIEQAHQTQPSKAVHFFSNPEKLKKADLLIASGLFNVKLNESLENWENYFYKELIRFWNLTRVGFGFNVLSTQSDIEKRRSDLFYVDPIKVLDFCFNQFGKNIYFTHDYGLYEFTLWINHDSL